MTYHKDICQKKVWVTALLLFTHVTLATYNKAKYREEITVKTDYIREESYISCICNGRTKRMDIRKKDRQRVYEKLQYFGYCKLKDKKEICMMYRNCHNCLFHMVDCQPNAIIHNKYDCQKKTIVIYGTSDTYVAPDSSVIRRRHKRDYALYCSLPEKTDTYELICRRHSSYICQQRCILGYTLKNGISGKRRCFYKENMWKPRGFKECQPFIDCEMTLIKPGILDCYTATTTSFPSCNVTCYDFEGKSATPMEQFECTITGTWGKPLPFCVVPKSGKELVPPPKIDFYQYQEDWLRLQDVDESNSRIRR